MKIKLTINYEGHEHTMADVETENITLQKLMDNIYASIAIESYLHSGKILVLDGVIPLYEKSMDINNDVEPRSLLDMYTDLGYTNVKLGLRMISSSSQVTEVGSGSTNKASSSHEPIDADITHDHFEWSESESESLENNLNRTTSSEIDEINGDNEEADQLSGYESEGHEEFVGLGDGDDRAENSMSLLSEQVIKNYFQFINGDIELSEGKTFDDVNHFRAVMKSFAIQEDFPLERLKNEKSRVTMKCKRDGCTWRIHASPLGADQITYMIKSYNPVHTCDPFGSSSKEASAAWIAEKMKDDFEANPLGAISVIAKQLTKKYGVKVNNWKLYRARTKALDKLAGDHKASYAKLPKYIAALKDKTPDVFIGLKCAGLDISVPNSVCTFERLFVCFPAQRNGFIHGCRPFIGIDGCFLKSPFGGQLLVATALDANYGILPLAYMFAETESEAIWSYFLQCLDDYLGDTRCLTFMSDRQKGILKALKNIFPSASNRFCARHRYNNFKDKYPGPKLRQLFWRATRAANTIDFNETMDEIKVHNVDAWEWLMKDDPKHWYVYAFDKHVKNDHVTNNITESVNSWLDTSRQLPIQSLMEFMRRKIMKRFYRRFQKAQGWAHDIPPRVRELLEKAKREGRHIHGLSNGDEYEVDDENRTYLINLNEKTCQCGSWQINGVPCKHAMACIYNKQVDPHMFVDPYLTKAAYLRTYSGRINTLPSEKYWNEVEHPPILPPIKQNSKRGRPKMNRRREPGEAAKRAKRTIVIHCRKCNGVGHNSRSCSQRLENNGRNKRKRSVAATSSQGCSQIIKGNME